MSELRLTDPAADRYNDALAAIARGPVAAPSAPAPGQPVPSELSIG